MNCPSCKDAVLHMTERQGIEIDYCPKCRGVWLDRGELDKFIQQSEHRAQEYRPQEHRPQAYAETRQYPPAAPEEHYRRKDEYADRAYPQRYKKKESFWGEIFDFD